MAKQGKEPDGKDNKDNEEPTRKIDAEKTERLRQIQMVMLSELLTCKAPNTNDLRL